MRPPEIRTESEHHVELPLQFSRLRDMSYNLWWTWSHRVQDLFARMDPWSWRRYRNPVELLLNLDQEHWFALQNDAAFKRAYLETVEEFDAYMMPAEPTWFDRTFPGFGAGPIAYFSTEYGWHESLQSYSGGLGVLSGDHSKSASDLGLPFVGVGLMYRRGYFHQTLDADGQQQHFYPNYDLSHLPLRQVTGADGHPVRVAVELNRREVQLRAWLAQVGRVPVLLLDSDDPANDPADRPITSILYISGREMRLCQEIVLGIGGVRLLGALGIAPSVWHMNEGHSALLSLERVAALRRDRPMPFADAVSRVAANAVFTTHTPVPAGNETFDADLFRRHFGSWAEGQQIPFEELLQLGRSDGDGSFNMTALAIRTSRRINGVSKLHGDVATDMWKHLLSDRDPARVEAVTNGVHLPTWVGPEVSALLREQLGRDHNDLLAEPDFADKVLQIPDAALWEAHRTQKQRLLDLMRERAREKFARHGRSPDDLQRVGSLFSGDLLMIGFARRFATYKRANLLLRDLARMKSIVNHESRPVQFLFAGKAHPADRPGQDLIREIWQASLSPDLVGRLLFLENYDMQIGRMMVQGVDVWLNNPKRPLEASGTSGMKAAMNGGLNCSILDGWWVEGFDAEHGWRIGTEQIDDEARQADHDADSLYRLLGEEIAPCYYDERDGDGVPRAWTRRMKLAIARLSPRFSTSRMVRDYCERLYVPLVRTPVG